MWSFFLFSLVVMTLAAIIWMWRKQTNERLESLERRTRSFATIDQFRDISQKLGQEVEHRVREMLPEPPKGMYGGRHSQAVAGDFIMPEPPSQ